MKKAVWKNPGVITVLLLVIISLVVLSACGGGDATTTQPAQTGTTTTPAANGEPKVLKIGSVANFQTKEGLEVKKWHDLFVKRINAEGGWKVGNDTYLLEIITYDGGNMEDSKSRSALEKLIYEDKVAVIVNTFMVNDKQAAQICKDNGLLLLGEGFTDDVAVPEFTNTYRTTGIYFGRAMNYKIAFDYYEQGSRKLAFINGNSEQSQVQVEKYGQAYEMAGFEVLEPVFYNADTVDFGPIATKVKSMGADSVCFPDAGSSLAINIMGALYDVGWEGTIFPSSLTLGDLEKIYSKVGDWCDGMLGLYLDPRGIPTVQENAEMKGWLEAYTEEYGTFVESGCLWVGGFWFLRDAVLTTQSVDMKVIQAYLDKSDKGIPTLTGYAQLFARPDLQNYRTMDVAFSDGLAKVVNGKFEFYKVNPVQDQYLGSIMAYGLQDVYKAYWDEYGKPSFPSDSKYALFSYDNFE